MLQHASERPNINGLGLDNDFASASDLKAEFVSGGNTEVFANLFGDSDLALGSNRCCGHVLTKEAIPVVIPYRFALFATCACVALLLPNITTIDLPVAGPRVEPSMMAMPQSS